MKTAWLLRGLVFLILCIVVYSFLEKAEAPTTSPNDFITSNNQTRMYEDVIVRSPAFQHEQKIPSKYTCDGENISPPIAIDNVPEGTVTLVLIMDDPDAPKGNWDHWIVFNIEAGTTRIGEGVKSLGTKGRNSWDTLDYGGPCPHEGVHRYFFNVYALDTQLNLPEGATKEEILREIEGHTLGKGTLMGTYERM